MTRAELDKVVASLRTVGGAYVLVAAAVERDARGRVSCAVHGGSCPGWSPKPWVVPVS